MATLHIWWWPFVAINHKWHVLTWFCRAISGHETGQQLSSIASFGRSIPQILTTLIHQESVHITRWRCITSALPNPDVADSEKWRLNIQKPKPIRLGTLNSTYPESDYYGLLAGIAHPFLVDDSILESAGPIKAEITRFLFTHLQHLLTNCTHLTILWKRTGWDRNI